MRNGHQASITPFQRQTSCPDFFPFWPSFVDDNSPVASPNAWLFPTGRIPLDICDVPVPQAFQCLDVSLFPFPTRLWSQSVSGWRRRFYSRPLCSPLSVSLSGTPREKAERAAQRRKEHTTTYKMGDLRNLTRNRGTLDISSHSMDIKLVQMKITEE